MSILFYCSRGHSLTVSPALAGKKVRCPVCLEVVVAPHVAMPVEEEPAGEKEKAPLLSTDPTPVIVPQPQGTPLEIPDNPSIAPLDPIKSPSEGVSDIRLEIPESPALVPLHPHEGEISLQGKDNWDEVPSKKTPPPLPVRDEQPPLPTAIVELPVAQPELPPPLPVAVPVFASSEAIREGEPEMEVEEEPEVDAVGRPTKIGKRKQKREQMRRVQLGLGFHFWKYLTYILGINLMISGVILATFMPLLAIMVVVVGYIAILVSPILGIVGSILCTSVPAKIEARPLITVSLGLDASCLLLGFLGGFIGLVTRTLPGSQGIAFLVFLIASTACGLAAFVLFMLFLRKLATYLDDHKTADEAMTHMINLLAVVLGGGAVMIVTAAILFNIEPWLGALAVGLEYLCFFVLYLKVLFAILDVISTLRARIN